MSSGKLAGGKKILHLKQRQVHKGLILISSDISQLEQYISFPNQAVRKRVLATWPGPVTWVLPAKPAVPVWIRGEHDSVAVRVSNHPLVRELCSSTGPIVSTSANPAGRPPARSLWKVLHYFGRSLDYILPGKIDIHRKPTEIRDAISGKILRI